MLLCSLLQSRRDFTCNDESLFTVAIPICVLSTRAIESENNEQMDVLRVESEACCTKCLYYIEQ